MTATVHQIIVLMDFVVVKMMDNHAYKAKNVCHKFVLVGFATQTNQTIKFVLLITIANLIVVSIKYASHFHQ